MTYFSSMLNQSKENTQPPEHAWQQIYWITNLREQLGQSSRPKPSFQKEIDTLYRLISERHTWDHFLLPEGTEQTPEIETTLLTLSLGMSIEMFSILKQLVDQHERRKKTTFDRLCKKHQKDRAIVGSIEASWTIIGLDHRADQEQTHLAQGTFTLVESILSSRKVPLKDVDLLSNLYNDQLFLVKALKTIFDQGLGEITGGSAGYLINMERTARLIELSSVMDHTTTRTPQSESRPKSIDSETYIKLLRLCTELLTECGQIEHATIIKHLHSSSLEFDRSIPPLPEILSSSRNAKRIYKHGAGATRLFNQLWSLLPYVLNDNTDPAYPHLLDFLDTYRSVTRLGRDGQPIDYFHQLAVWLVFSDMIQSSVDLVDLMCRIEKNEPRLSDLARYFFEYAKHGVQRYPTSANEASKLFLMESLDVDPQLPLPKQALQGFKHIFTNADELFHQELRLTFQQLVKSIAESDELTFIPLAEQGFILPKQLGIKADRHLVRVEFLPLKNPEEYCVHVTLSIDQHTDTNEHDTDLSFRLCFIVFGMHNQDTINVHCNWRDQSLPEIEAAIEHRLALLLTQHFMITHLVNRRRKDLRSANDNSDTPESPTEQRPNNSPQPISKVKIKTRPSQPVTAQPSTQLQIEHPLQASVNMSERQKLLPLSLELSPELQARINRELAKNAAASPYVELSAFIQNYNSSQGLEPMISSQKIHSLQNTFRLRTHNMGILDSYRIFYERKGGGVGQVTKISYRNEKTYK